MSFELKRVFSKDILSNANLCGKTWHYT